MKKQTKKTLCLSTKIWGRIVAATVMSGLLYLSMFIIFNAMFSEQIGYRIYGSDGQGNTVQIGEHFYTEEENAETVPQIEEGQTTTPIKQMSKTGKLWMGITTSVFTLSVLAISPYDQLWQLGSRDDNMVRCGRKKPNPWRGVKVGLLANIPSTLLFIMLVLAKYGWMFPGYLTVFRLCNLPFLPYINVFMGTVATEISYSSLFAVGATLLYIPAVCGIAYHMGVKQFSIREKLTYAKGREDKK